MFKKYTIDMFRENSSSDNNSKWITKPTELGHYWMRKPGEQAEEIVRLYKSVNHNIYVHYDMFSEPLFKFSNYEFYGPISIPE